MSQQPPGLAVAAVGLAAAVLLGGCGLVGGLTGGGGSSAIERADPAKLPANPQLTALAFPKPESIGFAQGIRMCTTMHATMKKRGYVQSIVSKEGKKVQCDWSTPGISLIKAGSRYLSTRLVIQEFDTPEFAADIMGMRLAGDEKQRKAFDGRGKTTRLEKFPVGDGGYIYHYRDKERGDTQSLSRSGKYLMTLNVFGYVQGELSGGERAKGTALTEEVTYREVTDIIKSINGQGGAGPAQITRTKLRKTHHLAGLPTPKPPTNGLAGKEPPADSVDKVCGLFSAATRFPGVKPKIAQADALADATTWTCSFDSGEMPDRIPNGYAIRRIRVTVKEWPLDKARFAQDYLGSDLQSWVRTSDGKRGNTLLELPVGEGGYAGFYGEDTTRQQAGFVVGPTTYIKIDMSGRVFDRSNGRLGALGPMPAKTIVTDLAKILRGAGR